MQRLRLILERWLDQKSPPAACALSLIQHACVPAADRIQESAASMPAHPALISPTFQPKKNSKMDHDPDKDLSRRGPD